MDALRQGFQALLSNTIEKVSGTNSDTVQNPEYPLNKSTLQNAIEQGLSWVNEESSTSDWSQRAIAISLRKAIAPAPT